MDNRTLKKLQDTEIEILDVVAEFCQKKGIQYSLAAGTALGAVRHGGFIPWDDDIDISMRRAEYVRFINEWNNDPVHGFYLENYLTDRYCGVSHSKIRKDNTLIASESDDLSKGHHGIWIDIFPVDKLSIHDVANRKMTIKHGKRIILLSRANHVCLTDNFKTKIARKFLSFIPYSVRLNMLTTSADWLLKNDLLLSDDYNWISMSAFSSLSIIYPQDLLDETIDIQFGNKSYSIFKNYDVMLRGLYGDYMRLPPPEKRVCTHSPVKIQF